MADHNLHVHLGLVLALLFCICGTSVDAQRNPPPFVDGVPPGWQNGKGGPSVPISRSCAEIKRSVPRSPSGIYYIQMGTAIIEVYCEMGINGGGYTFLSPQSLLYINNTDLQAARTDTQTVLMRIRKTDGTQPYMVLQQLQQYSTIPLSFALNAIGDFEGLVSSQTLDPPFLFIGFIPKSRFADDTGTTQGIMVNQIAHTFTNCGPVGRSNMALWPNFAEKDYPPYDPAVQWPWCDSLWALAKVNPSTRVMPPEIYMYGEIHFGGCACFAEMDAKRRSQGVLGFHIGFR